MEENKGESILSPEIIKLSEKLLKDPTSKLFFPLAEEYIKCSLVEEAIAVLTDGLKNHPGFLAARVSLGKVYLQKGKVAQAKAEFETVVAQSPDNLMAQKKLAQIYRDEGNIERARQICETILFSNPRDAEAKGLLDELSKGTPTAEAGAGSPVIERASFQDSAQPVSGVDPEAASNLQETSRAPVPDAPPSEAPSPFPDPEPGPPGPEAPPLEEAQGEWPAEAAQSLSPEEQAPEPQAEGMGVYELPEDSGSGMNLDQLGEIGLERPQPPKSEEPAAGEEPRVASGDLDRGKGPVIELDLEEATGKTQDEDVFSELLGASSGPESAPPQPSALAQEEPGLVSEGDVATADLADLYVKQGHFEQGIEIYRRLLEQDPDNSEIRQRLEDAMSLANLLTKRPREGRPRTGDFGLSPQASGAQETPQPDAPAEPGPEQVRQAKIRRLQAWLEQLRRSEHR